MLFQNRAQAGEKLGQEVLSLGLNEPFVLAIPRGGVPVGNSVARALCCPLEVVPLLRVSIPWNPDASFGAVAADGTSALNLPLIHRLELSAREIELAAGPVMEAARERENRYRPNSPFPPLEGRSVVIVDDVLGSGYSMLAAVEFAKKRNPRLIVAAAPVASDIAFRMLAAAPPVNLLLVLVRDPREAFSLRSYYRDFAPVTDDEVVRFLSQRYGRHN